MAALKKGAKVEVIKPCSTSQNEKGTIGTVVEKGKISLSDFGPCYGYLILPEGEDEAVARWEHASALRLIEPAI